MQYRLKQVDRDGKFSYSSTVEVMVSAPKQFALAQNFPNPFNPSTTLSFTIAEDGPASLTIYNMLGQQAAVLVDGALKAGEYHQATFDAGSLASGIYFARLQSGRHVQVVKMMLMK